MDEYRIDIIQVGEKYPQWVSPAEAFIQIHFRETYWELVIGYSHITKEETHEFQYGDAQMAYDVFNHHLFFLFKFGKLPWFDTPYDPRMERREYDFRDYEPGQGAPLHIYIVDSSIGEVKAIRIVEMSNAISNRLHSTCRAIQGEPFNESSYHYMIEKTHTKYSIPEKMLRDVNPQNVFMLIKQGEKE